MTRKKKRVVVAKSLTRAFDFVTRQKIAKALVASFDVTSVEYVTLDVLHCASVPFTQSYDGGVTLYGVHFEVREGMRDEEGYVEHYVDLSK